MVCQGALAQPEGTGEGATARRPAKVHEIRRAGSGIAIDGVLDEAAWAAALVLRLEICNECHPFFTGKQKLVDTAGRVERFNRRYAKQTASS